MSQFQGTGVALVTPFHEDFSIDYNALERVIDFTIGGGVDYLVVLGTTGESPTLSSEEKKSVLSACIRFAKGRVPIMYGLGGNSTQAVLQELKATNLEGVSAILSVSPYYNKPSQAGVIAHYQALADASPLPIILYNVPGRTMSNITAESTLTLAKHPNIIGIKEASGNWEQIMKIGAEKPKDFLLISGDDLMTIAINSIGGDGIISVLANALPATFKKLSHGEAKEQIEASFSLVKYNELMYAEGNPVGVKNLMMHLGVCGDQVRLPMLKATKGLSDQIKSLLK